MTLFQSTSAVLSLEQERRQNHSENYWILLTQKRYNLSNCTLRILLLCILMCTLNLQLQEFYETIEDYVTAQRKNPKHNCLSFLHNDSQCFGFVIDVLLPEVSCCSHIETPVTYRMCTMFVVLITLLGGNPVTKESIWSYIRRSSQNVLLLICSE